MNCNVCSAQLDKPVYESEQSLTSLCDIYPEKTRVRVCNNCGHLQTESIENIDSYYDQEYTILVNSEDEDQIYKVVDGVPVYRTAHQVDTFLSKVPLIDGYKILDYGCAKSSMMRALHNECSGISPYMFDVSDRYISFWEKFAQPENWATYNIPGEWDKQFDVVTSFFSLEHIAKPAETLSYISKLLKPGGIFYGIVPNVDSNIADFLVIDHVNHFTKSSLYYLINSSGMKVKEIDDACHTGAFVIVAERCVSEDSQVFEMNRECVDNEIKRALEVADYWNDMATRIRQFESDISQDATIAIYGAGFYGAFISGCMENSDKITCLIDQNPYLCGKDMKGVPVVSPAELPEEVDTILVGLNPANAQNIISAIPSLSSRDINYFYL